ncbi:MAG TPA: cellulase family glycosylhydrolase [Microthrixaceae bacterium]|nr:cellulase family glycosylhydrolase [Microthrixaceae bacterium]
MAALLLVVVVGVPAPSPPPPTSGSDALERRAVADLTVFTDWLGGERGYIGEVGWPTDSSQWNGPADAWYDQADRAGLWVTAWATGEWWGPYDLAVYEASGSILDRPSPAATVVEAHQGAPGNDRGVSVNGGEFGAGTNTGTGTGGTFSNVNVGVYDRDYHYESQDSLDYLASRGIEVIRLPFRWERVQPMPGGPLDGAEVQRLNDAIVRAGDAGLDVIPTAMNYGAYWLHDSTTGTGRRTALGSTTLGAAHLADLWSRLVTSLGARPNIRAWGLMNEPAEIVGGAAAWERISQQVVRSVRDAGERRTIAVPGYNWSTASRFASTHQSGPWIDDPADDIVYEAHQYFDANRSGEYQSYEQELANATTTGD